MDEYLRYFISVIVGISVACFLYNNISNDLLILSLD